MTSRDQFEQAYAEDHNCTLAWCQSQRLRNGSYDDRFMPPRLALVAARQGGGMRTVTRVIEDPSAKWGYRHEPATYEGGCSCDCSSCSSGYNAHKASGCRECGGTRRRRVHFGFPPPPPSRKTA